MNSKQKTYHHGDLRSTLLLAATKLIAQGGVDNLSMRKLADEAGVSRTAPYHHFKDKNALLCALAEQGFTLQDQWVSEQLVADGEVPPTELFERFVLTYIRFATEQQQTYDLMYGQAIWKTGQPTDSLLAVSRNSFRLWVERVTALQQQQVFDPNLPPLRVAQSSWAAMHGLCRLFIDGVYVDREDLRDIAKTTVQMLINPSQG